MLAYISQPMNFMKKEAQKIKRFLLVFMIRQRACFNESTLWKQSPQDEIYHFQLFLFRPY